MHDRPKARYLKLSLQKDIRSLMSRLEDSFLFKQVVAQNRRILMRLVFRRWHDATLASYTVMQNMEV